MSKGRILATVMIAMMNSLCHVKSMGNPLFSFMSGCCRACQSRVLKGVCFGRAWTEHSSHPRKPHSSYIITLSTTDYS